MPWKPGESGNPRGRSVGEKLFADQVRMVVHEDDPVLGKRKLRCLAEKLYTAAMAGEGWALCQIADRLDGKPAQESTITVNRTRAEDLSDDELADIATGRGEGTANTPLDPSQLN